VSEAPYDARNQADYLLISNSIEAALNLMGIDPTVPATEASLAKLAGCSRGTLRNRKYPLERLKAIKVRRAEQRKGKNRPVRITPAHRVAVEVHIDEKKILQGQLEKSRCEIAVWVNKYSDLENEVKKLYRVRNVLQEGKKLLEEQIEELKKSLRATETATANESEKKLVLIKS
jgi:hypothetical protein